MDDRRPIRRPRRRQGRARRNPRINPRMIMAVFEMVLIELTMIEVSTKYHYDNYLKINRKIFTDYSTRFDNQLALCNIYN